MQYLWTSAFVDVGASSAITFTLLLTICSEINAGFSNPRAKRGSENQEWSVSTSSDELSLTAYGNWSETIAAPKTGNNAAVIGATSAWTEIVADVTGPGFVLFTATGEGHGTASAPRAGEYSPRPCLFDFPLAQYGDGASSALGGTVFYGPGFQSSAAQRWPLVYAGAGPGGPGSPGPPIRFDEVSLGTGIGQSTHWSYVPSFATYRLSVWPDVSARCSACPYRFDDVTPEYSASYDYSFTGSLSFLPATPVPFGPLTLVYQNPPRPEITVVSDGRIIGTLSLEDLDTSLGFNAKLVEALFGVVGPDTFKLVVELDDLYNQPNDPPGGNLGTSAGTPFRGAQLHREVTIPTGADYMRFEMSHDTPGDGDLLQLAFGDTLLYESTMLGKPNQLVDSDAIYVGDLAGKTDRLLITLIGAGQIGTSVYLRNLRFYSLAEAIGLPGDYNFDGVVDAADYVVWRNEIGTQEAYDLWRSNFGRTVEGTGVGTASNNSIPEPQAVALLLFALLGLAYRPRIANSPRTMADKR